ncbi:MAG TPA: M61 family peptidase [Thermoanaerobaculia bacterium]|jgi:predicted metalloprotease with PDZ domain|nr:M61 family peptidase [Thermoanaerobaculia bacterium]
MSNRRALLSFTLIALLATASSAWPETRPIELAVDASDAPRGIFHSRLTIPAAPGPLTLAYPKWVQGEHAPTGPIQQVAGFTVAAGGKVLSWRRDPLEMFVVKVEVPAGAAAVEVTLDYLSPTESFGSGYGETPNATPHLAIVDWHDLLVYPLGPSAVDVPVRAALRLPAGWQLDTALGIAGTQDGTVTFVPTSLYTLINSPVLAGEIFRTLEVGPAEAPARISIAADQRSALAIPEARIAAYRRLPAEAEALFGAHHYRAYHWLLALSNTIDQNGLEHHESSDDRVHLGMFTDDALLLRWGTLLPHEYVHSWNGKYRRPAGLATKDSQEALRTDLLWVYEGLTRYLGDFLLTTRSGIRTVAQSREYAAWVAANQDHNRPGRRWRPLADTAASAQFLGGAPAAWTAYRRALDYYDESLLIWLEADTILREKSGGKKSLDDFCHAFFGAPSTPPAVVPYTDDDVYATLNRLVPFDWRGFFAQRVYAVQPRAPLGGLEAAGWKLVYTEQPNEFQKARAQSSKQVDETFTLGLWVKEDGTIDDVVVGAPAWEAGLGPGMKLVAVDGRKWAPEVLPEEIQAAKKSTTPIEITAEHGDVVRTFRVNYHDGERHPHLEREGSRVDVLSAILAARGR